MVIVYRYRLLLTGCRCSVVELYFSFKRFWINEEFSTPMNGNITTSISCTSASMLLGAPSGSVPQKICSTGKFLLAGECGKK